MEAFKASNCVLSLQGKSGARVVVAGDKWGRGTGGEGTRRLWDDLDRLMSG